MAANIEFNQDRNSYSFYSLKEHAWHGLGQVVEEAKTPEEVIRLANLDYEVDLAPMFASFIPNDAVKVYNLGDHYMYEDAEGYQHNIAKKGAKVPEVYATYRKDNYDVLGVVGNRYVPVQNSEAMDFIYNVCKSQFIINPKDVIIQTAGALGKGERIFVTAQLPTYEIAKDEVEQYILFTTSHDGSGSIQACFTNIRVVCNNTLNAALGNCSNMMRFRHTKNVRQNMSFGAALMRDSLKYSEQAKAIMEAAERIKITDNDIMDYISDLILDANQKDLIKKVGGIDRIPADNDLISTRKKNQYLDIQNYIDKGVGQDTHRGTLLWMYNGITSYINNGVNYKDELNKFDSITAGNSFKLGQKAINLMQNRLSA